jgi:hypothetical protein
MVVGLRSESYRLAVASGSVNIIAILNNVLCFVFIKIGPSTTEVLA